VRQLPDDRRQPLVARVPPDDPATPVVLARHEDALDASVDGYLDPASGAFVFTAATLWARGRCCASGCRHCPYTAGDRHP